jgi:hypothetical protein
LLYYRLSDQNGFIQPDADIARKRADELCELNFGIADAAHVAYAERDGAEFISCDDSLIKKCLKHNVKIWCGNPVAFCEKEGLR